MKRLSLAISILLLCLPVRAQQKDGVVKRGLGVGPFPALDSKFYSEFSYFTKGSKIIRLRYDTFKLIPGVRNCTNFQANIDKAYDFYGFNGYETYFDAAQARPFYRYSRYE